ncbi:MAG TPA: M56 family metallopeptidase, partial [Mucilaginibacter sp.]
MNWLHYLLEANIYLSVFYAAYYLFLKNETHYTLNRAYLLLSSIISFVLPVMQVGVLKQAPITTPAPAITNQETTAAVNIILKPQAVMPTTGYQLDWNDALWCVYITGIAILTLLLVIKLFRLVNMTTSGNTLIDNRYKMIDVEDGETAFSFFNYLFIGTKIKGSNIIIRHELVHIRQKHSADIIFIELIKIINWFNPVIYLIQLSLKSVHEYIADEQTAAQETDALTYSSFLVNNAYGVTGPSVTHSFFNYNLLKKRIIMLNQKRSGNLARLKYLLALPLCAGMLCASTLAFSKNYGWVDLAPKPKPMQLPADKATPPPADTSSKSRIRTRSTTSKGFSYDETGYLINNKTDFRVIITDKNGDQKEYYKSKATPAELAMLKEKYGYTFPKTLVYPKLPPPPAPPGVGPVKTAHRLPPPPPVAPVISADIVKRPPPPPPVPSAAPADLK